MPEVIRLLDATTRFSEIVEHVQATGETVTVTDQGRPAVAIIPCRSLPGQQISRADALREIARIRLELPPLKPGEIADLIAEGRR
jgi:prevent-host-death family protein